ncbi:MAG TPA: acyl-CoA dehydrogenase family protein [Acidimicrobiia bacterium]
MELEFTADQDELRDGVRAMLVRECPPAFVRSVVEEGTSADALWKQMCELGWPALTIAEELGGLGLGMVELAVVVEELGRVLAPGPFVPTVTQFAPVVHAVGTDEQRARFLGPVAEGRLTGALALTEGAGRIDLATVSATATRSGGGWQLAGRKTGVLGADLADEVVVVARLDGTSDAGAVGAFVVPVADVDVAPVAAIDATRGIAVLTLDGATVDDDRMLGEPGDTTEVALAHALDESIVCLALEAVGTCQAIFDMTLEYAKHREQFGVPIGSFQAIKHKLADMFVMLERARATGYFAALAIAEHDPRHAEAAATAKIAAGQCQRLLAKEGIQIHGGIGYTWEHDMHLHVRRVKTDAQLLGTEAEHQARLAALLLDPS